MPFNAAWTSGNECNKLRIRHTNAKGGYSWNVREICISHKWWGRPVTSGIMNAKKSMTQVVFNWMRNTQNLNEFSIALSLSRISLVWISAYAHADKHWEHRMFLFFNPIQSYWISVMASSYNAHSLTHQSSLNGKNSDSNWREIITKQVNTFPSQNTAF